MNDVDIQQIFFVECEEALEATEAGLDACKAGTHDDETINAIFRGVHSIKGGAGAFGHSALQSYTHAFENLLGDIREDKVELTGELTDLLLHACDLLRHHVEAARSGSDAPDDAELLQRLEAARPGASDEKAQDGAASDEDGSDAATGGDADLDALLDDLTGDDPGDDGGGAEEEETGWLVHLRPHAGAMDNGGEPLLWLRELKRLGGTCVYCDTDDVPALHKLAIEEGYLGWAFRMPQSVSQDEVREIVDFVGEDCGLAFGEDAAMPPLRLTTSELDAEESDTAADKTPSPDESSAPAPSPTPAPTSRTSQSVRIDLAKLDRMIDGVGELVIAQAMLAQRLENEGFEHIEELAMLETLVRDIQDHAMAFRAQPISSVFGRVPRLLRELSSNTGKTVRLDVTGERTELDKTVIERLSEPMTHLIRNAVDHGIEDPQTRKAAGKDAEGTLSLSAEQKAGRVIIRISDDGCGIDRGRVFDKAVSNRIIAQDAELSDEEICQLIFAPGFSTAAEVTSVSGRGVGMDVVKSNVRELGGRITIDSVEGQGTTFTLALPLTLAISDGMIVRAGDLSLVVPLTHVIESLRPGPDDLKGLGTQRTMLNVRGRFVPVISLGAATGARDPIDDPTKGVIVLVETEGHGEAALLVDAINDQRQFVIKSLDAHYRSVDGVAGATILGNGKVALIVDVDYLVQSVVAPQAGQIGQAASPSQIAA
jgi:two-component system chemotaxis sensor kinase CheA